MCDRLDSHALGVLQIRISNLQEWSRGREVTVQLCYIGRNIDMLMTRQGRIDALMSQKI